MPFNFNLFYKEIQSIEKLIPSDVFCQLFVRNSFIQKILKLIDRDSLILFDMKQKMILDLIKKGLGLKINIHQL